MRSLRISWTLFTISLCALAGCKPEDEIKREEVKHPDREKIRLRVAVLERPTQVYFFRFTGPSPLIDQQSADFEAMIRTIKVEPGKRPSWNDPKDWKKDPPTSGPDEMGITRVAGYRRKVDERELEIAVTRIGNKKFDLMRNMHRWQKQVNTQLTETHQDLDEQVKREKVNGVEVKWVDLQGLAVHTTSKRPEPMAKAQKNFVLPIQAAGIPFEYKIPKGWVRKPPRKIALEVLEVGDGEDAAEVTFVPLPQDGGGVAMNVNRWRKELDLKELPAGEVEKTTTTLQVDNVRATYVDMENVDGPPERNRTLGVMIPVAKMTWFVKMSGPLETVGQSKAEFETFVKSLKITK